MESGYYPAGAEFDTSAPWNQNSMPKKEIEVTVSVTLSKTMKIEVDDYDIEVDADEDGKYLTFDFSNCDFYKALEEQITLPQDLAKFVEEDNSINISKDLRKAINDCKDWDVDDCEIILE